jgi:hypothetical protein
LLSPDAAQPVEFVRVPYDLARAASAIRATDLPHEFAADLERGGVPMPAMKGLAL